MARFNVPLVSQRTYLTYAPPTPQKLPRNRLAIALPIIDQTHRAENDNFVDDKLGSQLTGKGRLAELAGIAATAPKSVTWFVDPALLDDAQALSRKHRLKSKDQAADPNAAQWLNSLRTALASSPVVATPYADPDVAALAHQGLDGQTATAITMGHQVATELLKRDVPLTTNWPVAGVLDPDALDLLSVAKVDRVLLNSTNLPPQPPVAFTPDAVTTLDAVEGPVTALVADAQLTRTFEPDSTAAGLGLPEQTALHRRDRDGRRRAWSDQSPVAGHRTLAPLGPEPDAGQHPAQDRAHAAVAEADPARLAQAEQGVRAPGPRSRTPTRTARTSSAPNTSARSRTSPRRHSSPL